jgi:hypothetical protein
MTPKVAKQVEALRDMTVAELREQYAEIFGEVTRSKHKDFIRKRITWRLQANEQGGLSDRALRRAEEPAKDSDLRLIAPRHTVVRPFRPAGDRRLPMPGTVLTREYRGQTVSVTVLDDGFEYGGQVYRSLTAVAKAVTSSHWNAVLFRVGPQGSEAVSTRPRNGGRPADPNAAKPILCAIYTRKSADEGLDNGFSPLDALPGARLTRRLDRTRPRRGLT